MAEKTHRKSFRKSFLGSQGVGGLMILFLIEIILSQQVLGADLYKSSNSNLNTKDGVTFLILHNNDMHARFEQTSRTGGKCSPSDAAKGLCYGGFARVAYE